jgi:hypothetical protein
VAKGYGARLDRSENEVPRPPCFSSLNTEGTEHPTDLRVEALRAIEGAEVLLTGGESFAPSEETRP